jgi:hypothetical protein
MTNLAVNGLGKKFLNRGRSMGGTPTAMRDRLDPTEKGQHSRKTNCLKSKLKKKSINDLEPELKLELPHFSLLTVQVIT